MEGPKGKVEKDSEALLKITQSDRRTETGKRRVVGQFPVRPSVARDTPATPTMAIAKATAATEWITEALLDPGTETVQ